MREAAPKIVVSASLGPVCVAPNGEVPNLFCGLLVKCKLFWMLRTGVLKSGILDQCLNDGDDVE